MTAVVLSYHLARPHTQPQTPARAPSVYTARRCECIRQPGNPHTPASEIGPRVKLSTLLLVPPKAAGDNSFVRALFREAGGCTLILGTIHSIFCPKIESIQTLNSKSSSMRTLDLVKPITNKSDTLYIHTIQSIHFAIHFDKQVQDLSSRTSNAPRVRRPADPKRCCCCCCCC